MFRDSVRLKGEQKMFNNAFKSILMISVMVIMAASPSFAKEKTKISKITTESPKAVELREALRDLWVGHIFWVRNVVLATKMGDAEGARIAEENVVKNARAIADAVIPFYGKVAADKLFGLYVGHYGAVKEYMTATYSGNSAGKGAAVDKIKNNATEIAAFLSSANPNWPKETLVTLLFAHGGHHIEQIIAINEKNYSSEAQTWEHMKNHMYVIADALGKGIVKQFPKKF
jgi:hypothetical protein